MSELEEYKRVRRQVELDESRMAFKYHATAYITANVIFVLLNLLTYRGEVWFVYPLVGWGVGLLSHYLFGVKFFDKWWQKQERKIAELLKK